VKAALYSRLSNMFWFGLIFWTIMFVLNSGGLLSAPLSEYAFWYIVGTAIGLPVWLGYDYWKIHRARS